MGVTEKQQIINCWRPGGGGGEKVKCGEVCRLGGMADSTAGGGLICLVSFLLLLLSYNVQCAMCGYF